MDLIFNPRNLAQCSFAFAIAIPLGLIFSFMTPQLAISYVRFVESRVFSDMSTPAGIPLGLKHVVIIIGNNLIPVVAGFAFPLLIAAYNLEFARRHPEKYSKKTKPLIGKRSKMETSRLFSELYFNLTSFALVFAFAFGFVVFGIFFGYLLQSGGVPLLDKGLRSISLHGPFEVAATLMSTSVALGIRDAMIYATVHGGETVFEMKRELWRSIKPKRMVLSLGLVVLIVIAGAVVEVYLSAPLVRNA